jgi:drug/metabolite transporter (DMT)-like permease
MTSRHDTSSSGLTAGPGRASPASGATTGRTGGSPLWPTAALLAAVLLWGGSFTAMRVAVLELGAAAVVWCRMIIALALVLPFAGKLMPAKIPKSDWKLILPMVMFQPCLYFLLESNALRLTTSSQAGVISAAVPLLVALGAWLTLRESLRPRILCGLAVSVVGVIALTLLESPGGRASNPLLGNLLEVLAMISAAANILLVKQLSQRYSPWTLTAMQVCAGALFFLPGGVVMLIQGRQPMELPLIAALLFLGAFVTLGAFGLYNWGMSRVTATSASVFINLVPVTAVILGWGVLGEALGAWQMVAAVAVVGGVWMSQQG